MRVTDRELIDDPIESLDELTANFSDIEAANRWLGGLAIVRSTIPAGARSVLDVGSGSGDVARALSRLGLQVTCLDASAAVLEVARRRSAGWASLDFVCGDGTALPFPDRSFDVVMCNLALHHFDPEPAVQLLRELRRVARLRPVLTDLRRSRLAWAGAWLFSRLVSRNRLTRHDAPLSALRAYTPAEALELAKMAGWRRPRVRAGAFFRMALTDG